MLLAGMSRYFFKVADAGCFYLRLIDTYGYGDPGDLIDARAPEGVGDLDMREADGFHTGGLRLRLCGANEGSQRNEDGMLMSLHTMG